MAGVAVASSIYVTVYIGFMAVLRARADRGPSLWRALLAPDWRRPAAGAMARRCARCRRPAVPARHWLWTHFAGVDGRVANITETYLHAVAFGLPAGLATRVYVALNAAVSRPTVTMIVNLTVLALKVPLNAVFMYGAGPIAPMGGAGAGVSTALLAWLALLLSVGIWHLDSFYDRFRCDSIHGPARRA
jgi:Na+-driven multidrug efflux pump